MVKPFYVPNCASSSGAGVGSAGFPVHSFKMLMLHATGLRAWRRRYVAVLAVLGFTSAAPLQAQQFRAAWADVFHAGMSSQREVDTMVSSLVAGRYSAVVVQVLGYMDRNGTPSHG